MEAPLESLSPEELSRRKLAAEVRKLDFEAHAMSQPWRSSQFFAAMLGGIITLAMGGITFWQGTIRLNAAEQARSEAQAQLRKVSEENVELREQAKRLQGAAELLAAARTEAGGNGSAARAAGGDAINQAYVASAQVLAQTGPAGAAPVKPVLYIQYGEAAEAGFAAQLRAGLRASGQAVVPPPERVGSARMPAAAELRYFHADDAGAAAQLANQLATQGLVVQVVSLAGKPVAVNARPGTLELWLARTSSPPATDKRVPSPVSPGSPAAY